MKIELSENIFWDTQLNVQNDDTLNWINENVYNKLGLGDPNLLIPEKDKYGRPIKWNYITDKYTIEIVREYIFPNSGKWSKKGDLINVISHE